jgi:diaminopimelate epimerase
LDDQGQSALSEAEMSAFARVATDMSFGVGCDNLLVVQQCTDDVLEQIDTERGYWSRRPDARRADYIFRMFEPTGEEALCCGNGLSCIADYLERRHRITKASIMTEVPLQRPSVLRLGRVSEGGRSWVDLGEPRRAPPELVTPGAAIPYTDSIELVENLVVVFREHDLKPYTQETELSLSGYMVFTGEPHLVIFPDEVFTVPALANAIFGAPPIEDNGPGDANNRVNFGSWLVHRIGEYLNTRCRNMFPAGVNVNFVRLHQTGIVEYRCFERGIDRETLACGTGALACAYVSHHLRSVDEAVIDVLPHRCRWHDREARIQVNRGGGSWMLQSSPVMLFEGSYLATEQALAGVTVASKRKEALASLLPGMERGVPEPASEELSVRTLQ